MSFENLELQFKTDEELKDMLMKLDISEWHNSDIWKEICLREMEKEFKHLNLL